MTKPNDSAFPMAAGPLLTEDGITRPIHSEEYGLTKREYFAGLAMQASIIKGKDDDQNFPENEIALWSIGYADALIAALSKFDGDDLLALLARLEAAEKTCKAFQDLDAASVWDGEARIVKSEDMDLWEKARQFLNDWRKSKGEAGDYE